MDITTMDITTMDITTNSATTNLETTYPATTNPETTDPATTDPATTETLTVKPCVDTNDCSGHYTCDMFTNDKLCLSDYTGVDCTTRAYSGSGNDPACPETFYQCLNEGHCFNASCCCPSDFTGTYCHEDVIQCLSNPCQNGGSCLQLVKEYSCVCVTG